MNNKIILAMMLFAMFFIGLQAAQPAAAATKIDQFNIYHMNGQSSDADVYKTYEYTKTHYYITITGYNWKPSLHKYVKNGANSWLDLKKISKTKIKITEPTMEGASSSIYRYTSYSLAHYYWHNFRTRLVHGLPF